MQNKKNYHVRHIPMAESVRGEGAVVRASSVAGEGAVSLESSSYPTDKLSADESWKKGKLKGFNHYCVVGKMKGKNKPLTIKSEDQAKTNKFTYRSEPFYRCARITDLQMGRDRL